MVESKVQWAKSTFGGSSAPFSHFTPLLWRQGIQSCYLPLLQYQHHTVLWGKVMGWDLWGEGVGGCAPFLAGSRGVIGCLISSLGHLFLLGGSC